MDYTHCMNIISSVFIFSQLSRLGASTMLGRGGGHLEIIYNPPFIFLFFYNMLGGTSLLKFSKGKCRHKA